MSVHEAKALSIETHGIEQVSDGERMGTPRQHVWLWAAANINPSVITTGLFIIDLRLSWLSAVVGVVIGIVLGYLLLGLVALVGARTGLPTTRLGRATFGHHGSKIVTLLAVVSCVGWEAITLALASSTTKSLLGRIFKTWTATTLSATGFAIAAAVTPVIAVFGYRLLLRAQRWISAVTIVLILGYIALVVPKLDWSPHSPTGPHVTVVSGIMFAMAGGGLGWVITGADYSRYLPRTTSARAVVGATAFGAGTGTGALMLFGVIAGASHPTLATAAENDPVGALTSLLPGWYIAPFLIMALIGFTGGGVLNLYSGGLGLLTLGVCKRRISAVLIASAGAVALGAYVVFFSPSFLASFQAFIDVLGVPVMAWLAIFLVDWFQRYRSAGRPLPKRGAANVAALIIATVLGLGMTGSSDPGVQKVVGYFMTDAAKAGDLGNAGLGIAVAFAVAALIRLIPLPRRAIDTEVAEPAPADL